MESHCPLVALHVRHAPQLFPLHAQAPLAWQVWPSPQAWQLPPPVPQAASSWMWQTPFWQQPVGQLTLSQTHASPSQRWPVSHV
jgi:hypothetical protein